MVKMSLPKLLNPFLALRIVLENKYLFNQLVRRNIELKYKGSNLGLIWSIVRPLMMLCVYTFVFTFVFKARWGIDAEGGRGAFALILFCGLAMFNIFSESVNSSSRLITANQNFVKKIIFPLEILPLAQVTSCIVLNGVWFLLLFIGTVAVLKTLSWTMLLLPLTLIPLALFTTGICLFISSLGVYLRDIPHLVSVVMQILFFMTPIFYPLTRVPEKYRWILQLNPLALIVEETRKIFLYGQTPNWLFIGICFAVGILTLQLGLIWFMKTKKRIC